MSAWGYRGRLGDARLTRAAMDRTARGYVVARTMFFGAPSGGGVTATLAATVGLALVASSSVAVASTATRTIAAPAVTGAASVAVAASSTRTVATPTLAGSAAAAVGVTAAPMLGAPGLAAGGTVAVDVGLSRTLGLSLAADASVKEGGPGEVLASLEVTLPGFALVGLAFVGVAESAPDAARPARRVVMRVRPRRLRMRRI